VLNSFAPFIVAIPPAKTDVPLVVQLVAVQPDGAEDPVNCSSVKDVLSETSPSTLFTIEVLVPVLPSENSFTRLSAAHAAEGVVNCNGEEEVGGEKNSTKKLN